MWQTQPLRKEEVIGGQRHSEEEDEQAERFQRISELLNFPEVTTCYGYIAATDLDSENEIFLSWSKVHDLQNFLSFLKNNRPLLNFIMPPLAS